MRTRLRTRPSSVASVGSPALDRSRPIDLSEPPRPNRPPVRPGSTRLGRCLFALLLVASVATTALLAGPPSTAYAAADVIEITGRGWGHGRGLGQYGSYGYAEAGWNSARILDHYYGGTSAGQAPAGGEVDPAAVRVDLRYLRGRTTAAGLTSGSILLRGTDGADLGHFGEGAVRLRWAGTSYLVETATSCSGPWTTQGEITGRTDVRLVADSTASGAEGLLHACGPSYRTWYRGELRAVVVNSYPLTVNVVSIADYLAGVVPNEMPASWPSAALEAQSVAARSYALAGDTRQQPYADTCDTTRCQVYDGVYTERGGSFRTATDARTDAAIAATAGLVRLRPDGSVARTEFSSSTGGHTAGGDFPAVADEGDSVAANPNHTWRTTVSVARIEARYDRGRLQAMEVVERNGHGADGGRVLTVEFRFEEGTVTASGDAVRSFLGLKSDWFTPVDAFGDPRETAEGAYIDRMHQALLGREAAAGDFDRWFPTIVSGDRRSMTDALVGSEQYVGLAVDGLYESALGRAPDSAGRAYWIEQLQTGMSFESAGILFHGSPEYYRRVGGTDGAYVDALYRNVLGRTGDAEGRRYWEGLLVDGATPAEVATGFYSSIESRRDRATVIHTRIVGDPPSTGDRQALAERLAAIDDLELAAELAASRGVFDA